MIHWIRRRCIPIFSLIVGTVLTVLFMFSYTPFTLPNLLPVSKFIPLSSSDAKSNKDVAEDMVTARVGLGADGGNNEDKELWKESEEEEEGDSSEENLAAKDGQEGDGINNEDKERWKENKGVEEGEESSEDRCEQMHDQRNDVIHVVTSGDKNSFAAMVTLATSVIVNTKSSVMFHFITFDTQAPQLRSVMESSIVRNTAYEIIPFPKDTLKGQFIVRGPRQELANPLNFVRFYLPELLPCVDYVVYLDVDCLVVGNIKSLYTWPIEERHVAALLPEYNKPAVLALNFSHPLVRNLTIKKRTRIMSAGVFVANLTRWRAQNITAQLDYWMKLNVRTPVVKYSGSGPGSQAIFLLVLYDKYTPLDRSWNKLMEFQSKHEPVRRSKLLHWNGPSKPWRNPKVKNAALWREYFRRSNSSLLRSA